MLRLYAKPVIDLFYFAVDFVVHIRHSQDSMELILGEKQLHSSLPGRNRTCMFYTSGVICY